MGHDEITSAGELRDLLGMPGGRAVTKERTRLHALPSHAALVKAVQETPETLEELEEYYAPANYSRRLY